MVGVNKTCKLFPHNVLLILISQYLMGGFNEIKTSKVKRKWFQFYPCSIYYASLHMKTNQDIINSNMSRPWYTCIDRII